VARKCSEDDEQTKEGHGRSSRAGGEEVCGVWLITAAAQLLKELHKQAAAVAVICL
jgi:hypothetical protein